MKFLHTADLHIGKTVNEFNLLKDQAFVLDQMVEAAKKYSVDAFVIAGDVYDRSVPPADAVELLDSFLTKLSTAGIPVLMIAGNHDSGQRLGFGEEILAQHGVHIAGVGERGARQVMIKDTEFVLLPFVRPAAAGCRSSEEAVKQMLETVLPCGNPVRGTDVSLYPTHHVLVAHCFATAGSGQPELSESESTLHVGGIDNVDVSAFEGFDYVALGHIHKPQKIGAEHIRYAGTPLAYSFSEDGSKKGMTLVELGSTLQMQQIPLIPLHAMRTVRGNMEELLAVGETLRSNGDPAREDYLRVVLTDELELLNPIGTLRSVYPNVMQIVTARSERSEGSDFTAELMQAKRPGIPELFGDFYELVRGEKMDENRAAVVLKIAEELE